jgi:OOP family OmpA-OmpF porin
VEPTLLAAKEVVERHDGKVCFHTVHAGEESEGSELLVEISQLTDCGSYRSSDSIDSAAPLYAFQRDVFLAGAPVDVAAPPPVRVSDADGDGVPDGSDACVDTPAGARVDSRGCWDLTRVGFASDSAAVDPNLVPEITALAGVLKANPDLSVRIEGHTDATGSEAYNQALSVRRADAVRASLEEAGVAADRIQVAGLGETQPVASNATAAGRAENRRIEFLIQR